MRQISNYLKLSEHLQFPNQIQLIQNQYQKMQTLLNACSKQNKQNITSDPFKQIRRLKIQLNDKIFQLRKLSQDHAEDKAKLYIQMQKEKQNNHKIINQYKNKVKQDNQSWSLKMDQIKIQYSQQIQNFKVQNQRIKEDEIEKRVNVIKEEYQTRIQYNLKMVKELEQKMKRQRINFNNQKVKIKQNITFKYQKCHQQQTQKHNNLIKDLKRQYEGKVAALQKLSNQQQSKYMKIKEEYEIYITQNARQRIKEDQIHRCLLSDVEQSNNKLKQLSNQIKQLENVILTTKQDYQQQLQKQKQENNKEIKLLKQAFTNKQNHLINLHETNIENLKKQMQQLVTIYKQKQRIWEQRGKQVLQLFQKRESKKQDKKKIEKLQIQLIKKDFMIQKQRKQLKNCMLQYENMQQIYDRIFIANSNLNRIKSKNYHIKKYRNTNIINQSNRSTIISEKKIINDK